MRDLIDEIVDLFPNIDRDIVGWRQS